MQLSNVFIIQAIFSVVTMLIAEKRGGQPLNWFIFGLILGPIVIIVALTAGKKCSYCQSWIPKESKTCRYCTKDIE